MALSEAEELELLELEEAEYQASKAASKNNTPEVPSVSKMESGIRGGAQGLSFGFADEITGALESLLSDKTYQQARDESRAAYEAASQANPITYGTGQVAGAIAPALLTGGGSVATSIGSLAAQGAAQGLGSSEADLTEGDVLGAAKDAAIGGTIGAVTGKAGQMLSKIPVGKMFGKAADYADEVAETSAAKALGAGKKEFLPQNLNRTREMGRTALQEKVVTPLASTDEMFSRAQVIKDAGASKMNKVYSQIDEAGATSFNPLDTAVEIENKLNPTYRTAINKSEWGQLENTIESILQRGENNIPMREAQVLKEEIGAVAFPKGKMPIDPSPKQQMAQDAYKIISSKIDDAAEAGAEKLGIDDLKGLLQTGKKEFSQGKKMSDLLGNKMAKEEAGGGLYDKINTAVDATLGLATPFTGGTSLKALAAKKGMEQVAKKQNQLTAWSADKISNILKTSPDYFGRFTPSLQAAAQRGGTSLAATHFLLQQTEPEYSQKILEGSEDKDK